MCDRTKDVYRCDAFVIKTIDGDSSKRIMKRPHKWNDYSHNCVAEN